MSCSYENCNLKCYDSSDRCIFHYHKRDWLTPKTKVWNSTSDEKIKFFWKEIRRLKDELKGSFTGFIFPKFEEFLKNSSIENGMHKVVINSSNFLNNYNFGYKAKSNSNEYYSILGNTDFRDVIFLDDADFSKISLKHIDFTNTIFEKNILFSWEKLINISFDNVQFKQDMNFEKMEINTCKFINTTFKNKISFTDSIFSSANFENSIFENDISFANTKMNGATNFKDTIFHGKVNFDNGSFEGKMDFTNSVFENDASFVSQKFKGNIDFSKVKSKNINFKSSQFIKNSFEATLLLKFNNGKYGEVDFSFIKMRANIEIEKSKFESIIWKEITLDKGIECIFKNVIINKFILDKYENKSEEKVLFDFVTVNKKLEIKNVSFDEERFNHFNLQKADIEIENSAFNNNFFNSVKWGTISENRYKATRDIFRQLKSYSEQQKTL